MLQTQDSTLFSFWSIGFYGNFTEKGLPVRLFKYSSLLPYKMGDGGSSCQTAKVGFGLF